MMRAVWWIIFIALAIFLFLIWGIPLLMSLELYQEIKDWSVIIAQVGIFLTASIMAWLAYKKYSYITTG